MKKYIGNIITAVILIAVAVFFEKYIVQLLLAAVKFSKIVIPVAAGVTGWLIWRSTGKNEINKLK